MTLSILPLSGDWTVAKYAELCHNIQDAGYRVHSIRSFIQTPSEPAVILRHDVDRFPRNALRIAELETRMGISATYYVRKIPSVFRPDFVKALHSLGHEVGYHYEVLAKARGDVAAALELFRQELAEFRELAPVDTASAHGSPLARWNNLDIWSACQPADFGLSGEAYFALDYSEIAYYTDTGRCWDATKTNLRDRTPQTPNASTQVHTTDELIAMLQRTTQNSFCIQTHPERWSGTWTGFVRSIFLDQAANSVKSLLRSIRSR